MSAYSKVILFLEEELRTINSLNPDLNLSTEANRQVIAQYLGGALVDEGPRFRSGRRLSDRVRDKLLDIQKWVARKP